MVDRPMPDAVLHHVLELEREVQRTETRANPDRLVELLDPQFVEIGASGRRWDLTSTLEMMREESTSPDLAEIDIAELWGRHVGDDIVQVFWESTRAGRRARRTSLWRRTERGWRLVYHQGTPA